MPAATMVGRANHPGPPLAVSESEGEALRAMTQAGTTEQRRAQRAKIILAAAEGGAQVAIAAELQDLGPDRRVVADPRQPGRTIFPRTA